MTLRLIFTGLALLMCSVAEAASPVDVYHFDTAQQQQRYRALIEEFRCPKCLNTNIAGSDAPIAQDLRKAVHRLVVLEQYTDQQVRDYLQARYGDFVLYDPPFTQRTWLIWMVPLCLGLLVLAVLFSLQRRARRHATIELNAQDQSRLKAFLEDD
ncbi:MAG: cytochrome c-type biogenesis protein CcmH [Gammaproteobacteria bacterium]|nr:cytochrome c-type biogenesis protein CcmH [Gammaproteobacteria bacterium]